MATRTKNKKRGVGHWITIGARDGEDGKRHGGSPVFVRNGRIVKGHPSLTGRKVAALKDEPEVSTHRQQKQKSREYERARWIKRARAEGVDKRSLLNLAGEIKAHHDAFADDRESVLAAARELSRKLGYGDLRNIGQRAAGGRLDPASLRGFDDVAARIANQFPEVFADDPDAATQRLFDLLIEGNPERMPESRALEEAFRHLAEEAYERQGLERDDGDKVPFSICMQGGIMADRISLRRASDGKTLAFPGRTFEGLVRQAQVAGWGADQAVRLGDKFVPASEPLRLSVIHLTRRGGDPTRFDINAANALVGHLKVAIGEGPPNGAQFGIVLEEFSSHDAACRGDNPNDARAIELRNFGIFQVSNAPRLASQAIEQQRCGTKSAANITDTKQVYKFL